MVAYSTSGEYTLFQGTVLASGGTLGLPSGTSYVDVRVGEGRSRMVDTGLITGTCPPGTTTC